MRVFGTVVASIALALLGATSAQAAKFNLAPPSATPQTHAQVDSCHSFLFFGGGTCKDRYTFTLDQASRISIKINSFGHFKRFDWFLVGSSHYGHGGRVSRPMTLVDLENISLDAGTYMFILKLKKGEGAYDFTIGTGSLDGETPTGIKALGPDPVSSVPLPGAALLFGSGLAALAGAGAVRKVRRVKQPAA